MAIAWTDITYLDVRLQNGLDSGYFYGNQRHQVGIVISLVPSNGRQQVTITQEELDASIKLIDGVTGEHITPLSGWGYSTTTNDYHGVAQPVASGTLAANESGLYQATRYISCAPWAPLRTRSIAVRIKPTAGKAINSAQHGGDNARVVLTALEAIDYRLGVNVEVFPQEIPRNDGNTQINYYFSILPDGSGMDRQLFKLHLSVPGRKGPFFLWTSGSPATKQAWAWPLGKQGRSASVPIVAYNQRPQEACITLLKGEFFPDDPQIDTPVIITLLDQYGNRGIFHARPNNTPDLWEYGDAIDFLDGTPVDEPSAVTADA